MVLGPGPKVTDDRPSKSTEAVLHPTSEDDALTYTLVTDSEGRAKELRLLSLARPHMLAFWINSAAFCVSFLATFAAAPLITSEYFTAGVFAMPLTCPTEARR